MENLMKNMMKKVMAIGLPVVLFAASAQGAGFALYEYSARGVAMGGATVANEAEPASLGTNPSLITELEGTQVQIGGTIVTAHAKTNVAGDGRELKRDVWTLPNIYITHKWSDQVSFGLGAFSRYGLGGEYKDHQTWAGSVLAYQVELQTFSFTPTIAIKANDEFSVAMGLEAMAIDFTQTSLLSPLYGDASKYKLQGTGVSWGGNFSLSYRPQWAEKWAFGAMYRTKVKQNLNGGIDAKMEYPARNILDADARGAINLPDSITAGVSFRPTENWTMEAGIVGTFWSSYDQILIEYKDVEATPTIHNMKNYKDTFRINLGTEYWFLKNWAVRAGYVYDKSPINRHAMDTLVPVDDRHIGSIGFGYKNDRWTADIAYAHIFAKDLTGTSSNQYGSLPMKYSQGRSDMYSLTVGYKF